MATPLIRTLSLVPRVASLEEFHCIIHGDAVPISACAALSLVIRGFPLYDSKIVALIALSSQTLSIQ